jgi:hypothetical protein
VPPPDVGAAHVLDAGLLDLMAGPEDRVTQMM